MGKGAQGKGRLIPEGKERAVGGVQRRNEEKEDVKIKRKNVFV